MVMDLETSTYDLHRKNNRRNSSFYSWIQIVFQIPFILSFIFLRVVFDLGKRLTPFSSFSELLRYHRLIGAKWLLYLPLFCFISMLANQFGNQSLANSQPQNSAFLKIAQDRMIIPQSNASSWHRSEDSKKTEKGIKSEKKSEKSKEHPNNSVPQKTDPVPEKSDYETKLQEQIETIKNAKLPLDEKVLVEYIQNNTLQPELRSRLLEAYERLSSEDFDEREKAQNFFLEAGGKSFPILNIVKGSEEDPELTYRRGLILEKLKLDVEQTKIAAICFWLAHHQSKKAFEVIFNYALNTIHDDWFQDDLIESMVTLNNGVARVNPLLLKNMNSPLASTRLLATKIYTQLDHPDLAVLKSFYQEKDLAIRYLILKASVKQGEKSAMPLYLALIEEAPIEIAFQIEDHLYQIVDENRPKIISLQAEKDKRKECRKNWEDWWNKNEKIVNLVKQNSSTKLKGITMILEVDGVNLLGRNGALGNGRVWQCGRNGQQIREWNNVSGPVDIQRMANDHFLLAEYYASRVTERDIMGKIIWESPRFNSNVVAAQKLPGGNILVSTMNSVFEVDRAGKNVGDPYPIPSGTIYQARRHKNGQTYILGGNELIVVAPSKKITHRIPVPGQSGWSGFDFLSNGNFLIARYTSSTIEEIDRQGKVKSSSRYNLQPTRVQILDSQRTLVAGGNTNEVIEFGPNNKVIWKVKTQGRPFAVLRY